MKMTFVRTEGKLLMSHDETCIANCFAIADSHGGATTVDLDENVVRPATPEEIEETKKLMN